MDEAVRRVHYFHGQLLGVADLQAEQDYHRKMRYLHNRLLGTGVAYGLDVTTDGSTVQVCPGAAIDPLGREIVLAESVHLDLPPMTVGCDPLFDVSIAWAEEPDALLPANEETGEQPFARWLERPRLSIDPPGSSSSDSLVLGRVSRTEEGAATVDPSARAVLARPGADGV